MTKKFRFGLNFPSLNMLKSYDVLTLWFCKIFGYFIRGLERQKTNNGREQSLSLKYTLYYYGKA